MAKLKHSILKSRGIIALQPHTRKPLTADELPTIFHKTRHMKYIELKYNLPITALLHRGTIYEVAAKYGLDPTTVSKWRKIIREAIE